MFNAQSRGKRQEGIYFMFHYRFAFHLVWHTAEGFMMWGDGDGGGGGRKNMPSFGIYLSYGGDFRFKSQFFTFPNSHSQTGLEQDVTLRYTPTHTHTHLHALCTHIYMT